ncbi:MAG: valine--tRNA ligase [Bryobacterales bacterium]|nr:valine--tRNA ligase [Bryobacteraceae bacterium]MDW8353471.1 valine--tRNA ligase [Bryobacterales bacterium]
MSLEKVYEPQRFEPRWAQWWVEARLFECRMDAPGPVFSLVIPPPNVTGSLHMGHMLEHTEIDATIRWRRMQGYKTLWLPGTDHAGIATQMVVERELARQGLDRRQLGREEFERRVWQWKETYGDTIKRQMIRLGASCDWSRERFTLDPGLSNAVREVFVRLYEKGLIYRGEYMVNWCPRCQTALSDLEVVREETAGNLWHIRYPIHGLDRFLVVATTRPETMLGDTAVAVHPRDPRYRDLHGRTVRLPLVDRQIPVIADELADPEFATGVVKITPAHDPNDFEAGRRHNLPRIQVIGETGHMTAEAGRYAGLDRFEARRRVVADLEDLGLIEKIEPYQVALGKCQRCKTVVEPLVSTQWFVRTKPLAEPAIRVVEEGRIRFIPDNWTKVYFEWMHNIRDWCISRQLWWGHRIPAWYCGACGGTTVARATPERCAHCGAAALAQDPDVLDTWFSSALWPFSTLGWPDDTDDLRVFYPTSLLITGFDILFFWVARMIMMGLECTGDIPFREVFIHGLVRDAERQKMSKTRGNVIDPLEVTEKYGTDAVRLALLMGAAPGTDIVLTEERMESARNFANKIWNAARFLFLNMERSGVEPCRPEPGPRQTLEDRWIFSRLARCAEAANRALSQYRYHDLAQAVWQFLWHEFCDWYVEIKKLRFTENSGRTPDWQNVLSAFETALRLLHPAMPFLTEELWQRLTAGDLRRPTSIALAAYPQPDPSDLDEAAERDMALLQEIVTAARNLRAQMKLDPKALIEGALYSQNRALELAREHAEVIRRLANVQLSFHEGAAPKSEGVLRATPEFELLLRVPAAQLDAHRRRLEKEIQQLEKVIAAARRQLEDQEFLSRAPAQVADGIRSKLAEYEAQLAKSRSALEALPRA